MYLARCFRDNRVFYLLRESFLDNGTYRNRDLIELGEDPGSFIIYPGRNSFYINDLIFERLQQIGVNADYDTIEPFFLPFLDPEVRARDSFSRGGQEGRSWKPLNKEERQQILTKTHIFDRRRMHFLRFGQVDQRGLDRSPSLFRALLHKSRDELEQLMLEQEQELSPHEYKTYIFTIFNLQSYFNNRAFARTMPYALNDAQLDEYFLKELCRLDQDRAFWQGMERDKDLVSYMVRYVIMFFDYAFPQTGPRPGATHSSFGRQQQAGQHTQHQSQMAPQEAASIFGVDQAELHAMSKTELTRLYRKKAQELHPDKGGEHEEFIALTTAYNELLRGKSG